MDTVDVVKLQADGLAEPVLQTADVAVIGQQPGPDQTVLEGFQIHVRAILHEDLLQRDGCWKDGHKTSDTKV